MTSPVYVLRFGDGDAASGHSAPWFTGAWLFPCPYALLHCEVRVTMNDIRPSQVRHDGARQAIRRAKFAPGDRVKHRIYPFRGVVYDVDAEFNNTEEWYNAIPAHVRPRKDQPFYHLLAENEDTTYVAYVSEQNLVPDDSEEEPRHPAIGEMFTTDAEGRLRLRHIAH